jgi:glutathione S-transferase
LARVPYEQVIEGNPRKGPKGKNPWVELDGERIGDSELIIDLLKDRHAIDLDEGLSSDQLATGHAWRRTFEEHYHQVLEWELFFHPAGAAWMRKSLASQMPAVLAGPVFTVMRSQFRKQLYARGIARHEPDIIAHKGRADLDALAAFLGDRPFLLTDRPTSADTPVFGLLAPTVYWSMETSPPPTPPPWPSRGHGGLSRWLISGTVGATWNQSSCGKPHERCCRRQPQTMVVVQNHGKIQGVRGFPGSAGGADALFFPGSQRNCRSLARHHCGAHPRFPNGIPVRQFPRATLVSGADHLPSKTGASGSWWRTKTSPR